jgi:hypothetical protein
VHDFRDGGCPSVRLGAIRCHRVINALGPSRRSL